MTDEAMTTKEQLEARQAKLTENLKLVLPQYGDKADVADLNYNFNLLDQLAYVDEDGNVFIRQEVLKYLVTISDWDEVRDLLAQVLGTCEGCECCDKDGAILGGRGIATPTEVDTVLDNELYDDEKEANGTEWLATKSDITSMFDDVIPIKKSNKEE